MGNISKLCGRRSTQNGQRGQRPNCQNGSESAQARNPENRNLPRMTKKEVKLPQLKLKRKKRKKKRKKRRNKFLHSLPHPKRRKSWFISGFSIIFSSDTICVSLQSKQYKKDVGTSTTLKHRKKDTSTKEVFHSYPTLEKNNYFDHFVLCKNNITMINNVA